MFKWLLRRKTRISNDTGNISINNTTSTMCETLLSIAKDVGYMKSSLEVLVDNDKKFNERLENHEIRLDKIEQKLYNYRVMTKKK